MICVIKTIVYLSQHTRCAETVETCSGLVAMIGHQKKEHFRMTCRLAKLTLGLALCLGILGGAFLWSYSLFPNAVRAAETPLATGAYDQRPIQW